MHVHVYDDSRMRTTIELDDHLRAKLLEAAAKRGEKGFSSIVCEALSEYFDEASRREERVRDALAVLGSVSDDEADRLDKDFRRLRRSWR